ncbi:hypothetical protein B0H15DRAFT_813174 [Mycena belliarum]|uniref:Homeobox domain-containing protein n=1 Tax=Mycena belliarum TaxID=1033014 RepID=A0AAD6UML2_9AGAR|nr:hypothetical protein B0H15DRAFT_813174 [Mycena belliae]
MTSPQAVCQTPLDVLADLAIQRAASFAVYDSHDDSSHSPPPSSPLSSASAGLPKRYITSSGSAACGAHHLRPRKKVPKSHQSSRLHLKPKQELKIRRKELMDRACAIKSLENSPVNEQQLVVLKTIYNEITMYPPEPWLVLMACVLHRSLRQIKNWFSNTRQKNRWGDVVCARTDLGERLRLRPSATELCELWSDDFFEEVLMILSYRTARRLQWERAEAVNKPATLQSC